MKTYQPKKRLARRLMKTYRPKKQQLLKHEWVNYIRELFDDFPQNFHCILMMM